MLLLFLAGGYFTDKFNFDWMNLDQLLVRTRGVMSGDVPVQREGETVRIASFNIQVLGQSKLNKPEVMQVLADVIRRFDVVAIQEIRSKRQDILPRFVELINAGGRHYDYVIGERLGRTVSKEQYAFIFDTASIQVDRLSTYTIGDPDDLLHREPMVASFRVRGPRTDQAFTFTLINIHTDPDETDQELDVLDDVYRRVRGDGRGEDDIILLGDLNVDYHHLGELGQVPGVTYLIAGLPTNTLRTKSYDNIIFEHRATSEFTGRGGVFDLREAYNLTQDQAVRVSDHMPVWGEFSIYEGGHAAGLVAERDQPTAR